MSAIVSIRSSGFALTLLVLAGCPNPGASGEHNKVTAPNAESHDFYFPILNEPHAVDCNTCHGEFDTFTQFNCLNGCHAQGKADADHDGMPGYDYTSGSCYACHPRGTAEKIDHSLFFPIASTDQHGNIPCSTCHANPSDRRDITCIGPGCHENPKTDADHQGNPDYQYVSAKCYACHPDGKADSAATHGQYFPIDAAAVHNGIGCASCHTNPGNRKDVSCANDACHPSSASSGAHGPVGGYAYDSPRCLRCHADSQVDRVAQHTPFSITSARKHYRGDCLTCHPGSRTDKPWGADFGSLECFATCHDPGEMADTHQGRSGYLPVATSCIQAGCHQDGGSP